MTQVTFVFIVIMYISRVFLDQIICSALQHYYYSALLDQLYLCMITNRTILTPLYSFAPF